jgi:Domain of unknown function (DUF1707)
VTAGATGAGGSLASDADRDAAAATLADAVASGRLSLAGHRARLDQLYAAVTLAEVIAVTDGLPPAAAGNRALVRILGPYRCLLLGGRARRTGRFRVGRFCTVLVAAGTLDLDLRAAQLSQGEVTFTVYGLRARVTVTVPPGARVADRLLVAGHRPATDDDGMPGPAGAPVIRLRGGGLACTFRVAQG